MKAYINTPQGLASITGLAILAASTNANVLQTGGWFSSHAILVAALSLGVFAGARVVGAGAGKVSLVIIAALLAGEMFNFSATAERIVVERENGAAPLKDAKAKHDAAIEKLRQIETGRAGSPRLLLASEAKKAADAAYDKELREGGRCLTICKGLKAKAEAAQAEVVAAITEAEGMKSKSIEAAKAEVKANPLPASATPLADRLGWAPWVLDLVMAGLLSIGANGLAGTLIAFGAHSTSKENFEVATPTIDVAGQSDFPVRSAEIANAKAALFGEQPDNRQSADILAFVRPNNPPPNNSPNGPKPGKRGSARKADVLADIRSRIDSGERFTSQEELRAALIGRFGYIGRSTLSDWLGELKSEVERTQVGRRKMVG
jgi:hypothetical protein